MPLFALPGFTLSLALSDCVCGAERSWKSTGPLTEDSCLPILQFRLEVSWDLPVHRSGPKRRGTIWYQLPSGGWGYWCHLHPHSVKVTPAGLNVAGGERCRNGEAPDDLNRNQTPPLPVCATVDGNAIQKPSHQLKDRLGYATPKLSIFSVI